MYDYHYPMINGFNDGWGIFMMVFWVVILIIIVAVVLRLLKHYEIGTNHRNTLKLLKLCPH
jgi:uncharacterized membrane protein